MISSVWIINHRCSWMTVYVFWRNARMNLIVIFLICVCIMVHSLFVKFSVVICSPNILFICYGGTPLVNYGPRSILNPDNANNCKYVFFPIHYKQTPFFHTVHLILCFQEDRWDWQPHCFIRKKITWLCCVQVPCSLLTPVVCPTNVSKLHLQKWFLPPTSLIKPWFHTEGKTSAMLHQTFLLGYPNA